MDYTQSNKAAWEEAYDNRYEGWDDDLARRLQTETLPYLNTQLKEAVLAMDWKGKVIAQFCCNNGREILSIMRLGASAGIGFDIAENMIAKARETARKTGIPCTFTACNILDIGAKYNGKFDCVFLTIGAITWFQELVPLFQVANRCLKPGGILLINDFHPFINMLPLPGEETFDPQALNRVAYSYFRTEPWLENNSGGYMTSHQNRKTFTSFSHTMGNIIQSVMDAGMQLTSLREFDVDIGITDVYNGKGFPLSCILTARKPE